MRKIDARRVEKEKGQGGIGTDEVEPQNGEVRQFHPEASHCDIGQCGNGLHARGSGTCMESCPNIIRGEISSQSPTAKQAVARTMMAARNCVQLRQLATRCMLAVSRTIQTSSLCNEVLGLER